MSSTPFGKKIKLNNSKVRQAGADFLFYSMIDLIVDHYYIVMEKLADRIEQLEEDIIRNANKRSLARINMLRKELILLKRSVSPVRELIGGILRSESELVEERTEKYFQRRVRSHHTGKRPRRELPRYDDEPARPLPQQRQPEMNEVMKVMAIVTCSLAPATVIGGIFGMNFDQIPLLHNQWGFFISVGLMLIVPIWMITLFRRRAGFNAGNIEQEKAMKHVAYLEAFFL